MRIALVFFILVSSLEYAHLIRLGKRVPEDRNYGFMVGIIKVDDKRHSPQLYCQGTLIRTNYILTAGHCLSDYFTEKDGVIYFAQYGVDEIDISDGSNLGRQIDRNDVHFHPNYTVHICADFDLALIKLPTDEHEFQSSIDLCHEPIRYDGMHIFISWINRTPSFGPFQLNYAEALIVDREYCISEEKLMPKEHHMCIYGEAGAISIMGDSGSPLIDPEELCQFGMLYCLWKYMVFVNVSYFNDWIDEVEQLSKESETTTETDTIQYSTTQSGTTDDEFDRKAEITTQSTETDTTIEDRSIYWIVGGILFTFVIVGVVSGISYLRRKDRLERRDALNNQFTRRRNRENSYVMETVQ